MCIHIMDQLNTVNIIKEIIKNQFNFNFFIKGIICHSQ